MKCPVCNSPIHQEGCPFQSNNIEPGFADEEEDVIFLPCLSDDY